VRVALAIVVPLVAALLQGSVVPFIAVGGARPNLVVLVAASWSVAAGAREGLWWAFVGGLAADLLSGGPLGAQALAALLPVTLVGLSDPSLRARSAPTGAVLVGAVNLISAIPSAFNSSTNRSDSPIGTTVSFAPWKTHTPRLVSSLRFSRAMSRTSSMMGMPSADSGLT